MEKLNMKYDRLKEILDICDLSELDSIDLLLGYVKKYDLKLINSVFNNLYQQKWGKYSDEFEGINEYDYTLEYTEKLFGEMNTQVTPSTIDYDGFTSPNKQTITISTNGSNVVDYYYRRNSYNDRFRHIRRYICSNCFCEKREEKVSSSRLWFGRGYTCCGIWWFYL